MSIQAVAWVLEHSQAKLADRLVLIAIANHVGSRGWDAWPSVETIATEAGVHEVTVWRSIRALEELGELVVQRRPGKSSRYGLAALQPLQSAGGEGLQDARTSGVADCSTPLASRKKPLNRMQPEPVVTVKEPKATPAVNMPAELTAETRARGAEFFRALRKGEA